PDHRIMKPSRREPVEGVLDGVGGGEQQCALAEVVEQQSWQNNDEPAKTDRQAPEMTHIRVHRLASGDRKEDRAKHRKRDAWWRMYQVDQRAVRADCLEDRR